MEFIILHESTLCSKNWLQVVVANYMFNRDTLMGMYRSALAFRQKFPLCEFPFVTIQIVVRTISRLTRDVLAIQYIPC